MIIPHIPSNIVIERISELSPSRYTWLRDGCAYSFLLETALRAYGKPCLLMPPISFNNVIGTIIHKIFQLANNGQLSIDEESIITKWRELCAEKQRELATDFPTIRNVLIGDYDAMFDTIDVVLSMRAKESIQGPFNATSLSRLNEHYLKIDGLLKGSIDRIRPVDDGVELIDYKTGKVYDETGAIKADYVAQLNLYAYMLEEAESVRVTRLIIIDRIGQEIPVPYYRDRKKDVFHSVNQLINRINEAIDQCFPESLCAPDASNCGFCPCQHLCDHRCISNDSPFHIIKGTVTRVWNNDQISLRISPESEIIIARLSVLNIDNLDSLVGKHLIFVNLLEIQANVQYNRCDKTAIYEIS